MNKIVFLSCTLLLVPSFLPAQLSSSKTTTDSRGNQKTNDYDAHGRSSGSPIRK